MTHLDFDLVRRVCQSFVTAETAGDQHLVHTGINMGCFLCLTLWI